MLTCPYIHNFQLRKEFWSSTDYVGSFDYQPLDAPGIIAAGSQRRYCLEYADGSFVPMPTVVYREQE